MRYAERYEISTRNEASTRNEVVVRDAEALDQVDIQPDFVNLIGNQTNFNRLRFQKLPDADGYTGKFLLTADDGVKHSTYGFVKDFIDDFIKIDDCYVGTLDDDDVNVKTKGILTAQSNKEIAFYVTYDETSLFCPYHGDGIAYAAIAPVYLIDDEVIDISAQTESAYVECSSFELRQNMVVRINGIDVALFRTYHKINTNGIMSFGGEIYPLLAISLGPIYCLMLPMEKTTLNEVYTGFGNSKVTDSSGDNYYFAEEQDNLISVACLSADNPNYVAVGTVKKPVTTMRRGATTGKPSPIGNTMRFWQDNGTPKMYFTSADDWTFTKQYYSWAGKIAVAEIEGIYNTIKS